MKAFDLSDTLGIRLLANAADAERCLAIYKNPEAHLRPVAAWTVLPVGYGVVDTLMALATQPVETDCEPDFYQHHLAILQGRRDDALALWSMHRQPTERAEYVN